MSDYLIPSKNTLEHYYHSPADGIAKRQTLPRRGSVQTIYPDGTDGFCVFADQNDCIHIISSNKNGDLVYLFEKNGSLRQHTLLAGNGKVFPKEIKCSITDGRTNLIYSAEYDGGIILIYCILGINAKPLRIASLCSENPQFSVSGTRVYFTNSENVLGYMDFADGKPDTFLPVCENAFMPSAVELDGTHFLVCKKDDCLYCNGNKIFEDKHALLPTICISGDKLLLLWKSLNFVKYSASQNNGVTWTPAMRFVNSGSASHIYTMQNDSNFYDYYGTASASDLHIIGAAALLGDITRQYSQPAPNPAPDKQISYSEFAHIKNELSQITDKVAELSAIVYNMKEKYSKTEQKK